MEQIDWGTLAFGTFLVFAYVLMAAFSYGPYGMVEALAGYAGSEQPDGSYSSRHATRSVWLMVAAFWPLTLSLAAIGWTMRKASRVAAWLRVEV